MLNVRTTLSANDIRALNKKLRDTEGNLLNEMRAEIRKIAAPINKQIKLNIPQTAPMGGMGNPAINRKRGTISENNGRLVWGAGKPAKSTSVSSAIKAGGKKITGSLARIILNSPAVSMSDMAGRVNRSRPRSRPYNIRYRDGRVVNRTHRVTSQGRQMIQNLGGNASRYGWAALEGKIDETAREIELVVEKYYRKANREI